MCAVQLHHRTCCTLPCMESIAVNMQALFGDEDTKAEIEHVKELHEGAVCEDKTFKVYAGGKHQLLQDKPDITAMVMKDSLDWMTARLE
jgi:alpha-beta hydrolase superfamily lysophospholipase